MKNKRKEALVCGDLFYNTGKVCKNGHTANRYTLTGACIDCLKMNARKEKEIFRKARSLLIEG